MQNMTGFKKVWTYVKTILAIIGSVAVALFVMRRSGVRRADTARGVVADIHDTIGRTDTSIRRSIDAGRGAEDAIIRSESRLERGANIVDELDATIGRGRSILGDIERQDPDPDDTA